MHRHPKVALWQREEDGSYKRDLGDFALHVTWHPESTDAPRGFSWKVEGPEGKKLEGDGVDEEIETAMLAAEDAAHAAGAIEASPG
jgi:hypothetical protein